MKWWAPLEFHQDRPRAGGILGLDDGPIERIDERDAQDDLVWQLLYPTELPLILAA